MLDGAGNETAVRVTTRAQGGYTRPTIAAFVGLIALLAGFGPAIAFLVGSGALAALAGLGALGVVGYGVGRALWRYARFGTHTVNATPSGLEVHGRVHVPSDRIERMVFVPASETKASKLLVQGRGALAQVEVDRATAERMMRVLRAGEPEAATTFLGVAPWSSLSTRLLLVTLVAGIVAFALALPHGQTAVHATIALATVAAVVGSILLVPSKVRVGSDGVAFETRLDSRFFPREKLRAVAGTRRGIRLETETGPIDLPLTSRFSLAPAEQDEQRALLARIESLLTTARPADRGGAWRLERGASRADDWLHRVLAPSGGYRQEEIDSADLRTILESQERSTTRLAAAAILARRGESEDRNRIRIAAEASASPKLRVALERVASGAEEEELLALAEAMSEEDAEDRESVA